MTPRRLLQIVVALAALVGPLAAVAHAAVSGSVTTAPVTAAAPAIGMPLLALLTILLAGGGAYRLRRTRAGAVGKLAFVAALSALAGLAYASTGTITIAGAQCGMQAVNPFTPSVQQYLQSNCPNQIRIISIQFDCLDPAPPNPCTVGQVLNNGGICALPLCPD